jgi:hypothetical protein
MVLSVGFGAMSVGAILLGGIMLRVAMQRVRLAWHRIEATGMPGMAFAQAARRQGAAAQGTMVLHRLARVLGASGIETALIAQPGA